MQTDLVLCGMRKEFLVKVVDLRYTKKDWNKQKTSNTVHFCILKCRIVVQKAVFWAKMVTEFRISNMAPPNYMYALTVKTDTCESLGTTVLSNYALVAETHTQEQNSADTALSQATW